MDVDTREWFDGVLTAAARAVVKEPPAVSYEKESCDEGPGTSWVGRLNTHDGDGIAEYNRF